MLLSIIVTNHQTPELLKLCLESIKMAAAGLDYEIIVVDSEAQDATAEIIGEYICDQHINLISFKKNQGYAKLVNAGLLKARGEYIIILNADLILFSDSLQKMIECLESDSKIGILGPKLLNFNGTVQDSCFRFYRPLTVLYRRTFLGKTKKGKADLDRFLMRDFDRASICDVDWLLGAALMVRSKAFDGVGLMDEKFFLYFEDVDWCRRFARAGWRVVYYPEAKMHHYHGRISKKSGGISDIFFNKYTWIHLASAIKYFWKYRNQNS